MLTESDCKKILKNFLKDNNYVFKKFDLKPISEDAEGFMGDHYKLLVTYEYKNKLSTQQFFMKTQPMKNPAQQEMTQGLGMFTREIFTYEVLLKEFDKYGFDTSFASTSYHCLPEAAVILEDLTLKGYDIPERHEMFSMHHVRCALDALASYHACGFAYEQIKTAETGEIFRFGEYYKKNLEESIFVQFSQPDAYAMKWWKGSRKTILKIISLLEGDARFENFEKKYLSYNFGKVFVDETNIRKTCGHGDLWSNNLMFICEDNVPIKCRLLDFQITRYFYPCLDVLLMIFSNTNAEFRREHLDGLYKYYFDSLRGFLRKYGCLLDDIHPWGDFLRSIKLVMPDALTQVLLVYFIGNLPKNMLSNIVNEKGNQVADLMFDNSEIVAKAFKNDCVYRGKILEMMGVFYDVLAN